jgi:membrane protein required for colicin V production
MNWVDAVVVGVVLLSGLLAFARGLTREALGLGSWLIAAAVASPYGVFPLVDPWMRQQFSDQTLADTVAFVGVFVLVLIVLSLISGVIASAIRGSVLGGLDRMLGLIFGLGRGALVVCAAYILAGLAVAVDQWPPPVLEARSLPIVYRGAAWLAAEIPTQYRPTVSAPPPVRPVSSAALPLVPRG